MLPTSSVRCSVSVPSLLRSEPNLYAPAAEPSPKRNNSGPVRPKLHAALTPMPPSCLFLWSWLLPDCPTGVGMSSTSSTTRLRAAYIACVPKSATHAWLTGRVSGTLCPQAARHARYVHRPRVTHAMSTGRVSRTLCPQAARHARYVHRPCVTHALSTGRALRTL
eukprot:6214712-Pleurochrysis_carterae.AAC.5